MKTETIEKIASAFINEEFIKDVWAKVPNDETSDYYMGMLDTCEHVLAIETNIVSGLVIAAISHVAAKRYLESFPKELCV